MNPHFKRLEEYAREIPNAKDVWKDFVTNYPFFDYWSGSHREDLHHYGDQQLTRHVLEVFELGLDARRTLKVTDFDLTAWFFASVFHDSGKLFDYRPIGHGAWEPLKHRRLIHHLPRSAIIWHDAVVKYPDLNLEYHDDVLHAILAHHGSREAGSPVAPKTRLAWMLHLCDGLSARMDDADTLDIVKVK